MTFTSSPFVNTTLEVIFDVESGHAIPVITRTFATILIIVAPLTVLANIGTSLAFWREPSLRQKPSDLLLVSLTCCDLGMGAIVMPLSAMYGLGIHVLDETGCRFLWNLPADMFTCVGTLTMMMISRDRYLLVASEYPKYLKIQTRKRITLEISIIWCFSIAVGVLDVSVWDFAKTISMEARLIDFNQYCLSPSKKADIFALPIYLLVVLFPTLAVVAFSVLFMKNLRHRLRQRVGPMMETEQSSAVESNNQHRPSAGRNNANEVQVHHHHHHNTDARVKNRRYIKPAVTLGLLVAAMGLCIGPYCIFNIVAAILCPACDHPDTRQLLIMIMLLNSFLNPFLYTMTNSKIRQYFRNMFSRVISRRSVFN